MPEFLFHMKEHLKNIIKNFPNKKILVIGDVMLDKYIHGDVSRISPEAPVQIVQAKKELYVLGGAGNVVSNLAALNAQVTFISSIGKDKEARILKKILDQKKIKYKLIETNRPTIVKTRVVGRKQHLLRIDYENYEELKSDKIIKLVQKEIKKVDAVIISDYAKGLITKELVNKIVSFAKGRPIIADTKHSEKLFYKGVSIITPNEKEAYEISGADKKTEIILVMKKLEKTLGCKVLITRGEKGMSLLKQNQLIDIPTKAKEIYDVSGAGDTVISALALSIVSGASLEEAAIIANHSAGIVVGKFGTETTSLKELLSVFEKEDSKIKKKDQIEIISRELKKQGKKVVFTNGCFDILHVGHVKLLEKAKEHGDILILGLNTDASIKRLKGPSRPIIKEMERAEMLAALECVNYVVLFNEDTPVELIKKVRPNIHIKGGDYKTKDMPETKYVEKFGGKVVLIPLVKGFSTTDIIKKIKNEK
ncbi:MAG: D-glycero-beta-D-manno-heptose-7-phosphate kinase [archaeon]